ncbi:hypothetical protein AVEN_160616-1 [Araneus ventricosus]|uniref:Uncharacterized protein n=1 Tax=Araneus ventricosus TaxID=182803 RepID=A0A4Y2VRL0_ARAVE|nr:hypothetical protein AVEN_80272-1 [Araneus ventricosus]GBO26804.1 hypothetical protein AVEN_50739-1 [Araneus ventricosus]GBO40232.1 hypothetical protein AVEN_160616-1 [Araneus ventricosus]
MERFGYIVTTESFSSEDYNYIHDKLFDNILECVEDVRQHNSSLPPGQIRFFKILSNSEIEEYLIALGANEKRFGFCQLTKYNPASKYNVSSSEKILYETIVGAITAAKNSSWPDICECSYLEGKYGYMKLLDSDSIVYYLHYM